LGEVETKSLVQAAFFGVRSLDYATADSDGNVTSAEVQAVHRMFKGLSEDVGFKDTYGRILGEPSISAESIADCLQESLDPEDPARRFVESFSLIAAHVLRAVVNGPLFVEPHEAWTSPIQQREDKRNGADQRDSANPLDQVAQSSAPVVDEAQIPLSELLVDYLDFRESRAPSLSEQNRAYLRLRFLWGKDMRSISRAANVTYQRVQQVVGQATHRLQDDLLVHESYQRFWASLHRFCIVTPGVLSSAVTAVLGDREQAIDTGAAGRFLYYELKSTRALVQYRVGRTRVHCCRETQEQLDAVVQYLREIRTHKRGPVSDSDVSAASMYILSHSELPGTSVRAVAALLLAAMSPPDVAEQLEGLLAKRNGPCHFADLARCLDEEYGGDGVSTAYIHAVLARNHRFAWAGLGTYALSAWGYPRETSTLGVVLHMIRAKNSGVTLSEVNEFMFVSRKYSVHASSVRQALKLAEGRHLRKVGVGVWDELHHGQRDNEVTEHE
jgi:hypothetical protein